MKDIVYSSRAKKSECHVKDDFLLVWIDDDCIKVVRVGSHSELF